MAPNRIEVQKAFLEYKENWSPRIDVQIGLLISYSDNFHTIKFAKRKMLILNTHSLKLFSQKNFLSR